VNGEPLVIPGRRVKAVDTTGAGDCFVGALAAQLAGGKPLGDALDVEGTQRRSVDEPRAAELEAPSVVIEFEKLPPMTEHPSWGLDIVKILLESMDKETARACYKLRLSSLKSWASMSQAKALTRTATQNDSMTIISIQLTTPT